MSDSENDLLSNPFHYQNDITVVSAKGPNINTGNMSFRNNFSSTLQMPRTFEPRYAESCYDPRSGYSRREPSPMSVASACDARYRNFNYNNSQYRGMSSQRSVYNGRSGSPMSVRTFDSTASVSATDIAMALKHVKFNKYDMRIIKEAFNSLVKKKSRKRIEKRRNLKLFMKGNRRRSGYDSGEQASDSSLSSDNGGSVRTGFEENMSSFRSNKTDLVTEIRKTIREGNIYKDCTDNFRQNSFRKMVNGPDLNNTQASMSSMRNPFQSFHAPRLKTASSVKSLPNFQTQNERFQTQKERFVTQKERFVTQKERFQTQKERFQNGYVLPSQRFNKSGIPPSIPEIPQTRNDDTDSDYDLFSTNKKEQTNNDNRKRSVTEEDVELPNNKRAKVLSPCKNSAEAKMSTKETNNEVTENPDDFEFAKPIMPVRKFKEKIISKSGPPPPEILIEPPKNQQPNNNRISKERIDLENDTPDTNLTENSEVSMRPSFIKRKLFTQKMDVTENKNQSTDNINSPQNSMYSAIQKERHKARKLVTNQSCLSRDIQDDNNLLDLIHKIVPANSMNVTTQSNTSKVTKASNNNHNKSIDSDKFDVTSIITKNGNDSVSDTFTDEEVFNPDDKTIQEIPKEKSKQNPVKNTTVTDKLKDVEKTKPVQKTKVNVNEVKVKKTPVKEIPENFKEKNCIVSLEKIPIANIQSSLDKNGVNKPKCWSTFWDLDSESDVEIMNPKRNQINKSSNESISEQIKNTSAAKGIGGIFKKPSVLNATSMSAFDTTQRLNITGFKIRSHRSPKLRKCCDEIKGNTIKSYFETSVRKTNSTLNDIDDKKTEKNVVQKTNINNNIVKIQKDTKTTEHKNTKQAKKTPQKDRPNTKTKVNKDNINSIEKKQKKNEAKTKTTPEEIKETIVKTPKKRGRPPKSTTQNKIAPEKVKSKTPVKNNTKNEKINNSEGKPKNGQIKALKNNSKENLKPADKKTNNTKPQKKTDNIKNNKHTQKILLDSSLTNSTSENDNSKIYRAIRSCRISKNSTINSSKDSFNLTMTLRSRNLDISKSINTSGLKLNIPPKEKSKQIR